MTTPLPVVRAAELDDAARQPRWLVKDLWAAGGVGVIGGHPKSLKTWLGLEIAVSVATYYGRKVNPSCKCLNTRNQPKGGGPLRRRQPAL